jgi:hypothetical protein
MSTNSEIPIAGRPKVVIRGSNIFRPPLFETTDANIIEFRDGFDDLCALFFKVINDDLWGFVTKNDPDWEAVLVRYGYLNVKKPVIDVIKLGL